MTSPGLLILSTMAGTPADLVSFGVWISVMETVCGLLVGYGTRYLLHHGRFHIFWLELAALGLAGFTLIALIGEEAPAVRLILAAEFLWLGVGFVAGLSLSPVDKPFLGRCQTVIARDKPTRLVLVKPRGKRIWRRLLAGLTCWALFWSLFVGLGLHDVAAPDETKLYLPLLLGMLIAFLAGWLLLRAPRSRLEFDIPARQAMLREKKKTKWLLPFDEIAKVTFDRVLKKKSGDYHITLAMVTASGVVNIVDEGIEGAYLAMLGKKIAAMIGVPFDDLQDVLDREPNPEEELGERR